MDSVSDFWAPRNCFLPLIPELGHAIDLLGEAADALLSNDFDRARDCLHRADMPEVHAFAHSIMGTVKPAIHRLRPANRPSVGAKAKARMPSASVEAAIYSRDGWRCRFCGVRIVLPAARKAMIALVPDAICWSVPIRHMHAAFLALSATVDHVVPHALGGESDLGNLVTACWPCNFGRGDRLIEEVGLIDPWTRPPIIDEWDGLARMSRRAKAAPSAVAAAPTTPPSKRLSPLSEAERFSELNRNQLSSRLLAFLASCEALQISWSLKKVLIVRMSVDGITVELFGVEPNGDVHIPWSIGKQKTNFRGFAEKIAAAVPGANAYETPKMWVVSKAGKKLLSIQELLDASTLVRSALEDLNKALKSSDFGDAVLRCRDG